MLKRVIKRGLHKLGYGLYKLPAGTHKRIRPVVTEPPPRAPIWPLPRHPGGLSDQEIRAAFAQHEFWHYAYEFDGGLKFSAHHNHAERLADAPRRPLQRFSHFMPSLLQAEGGSLKGKRVLDIACNSGFWAIQCGLLGAEVVGFDARPELIEQANLIKQITGTDNVEFKVLDFWEMNPEALGGKFDVVFNLGILYHLPKPLEALELTFAMARGHVLLDTALYESEAPIIYLRWEEPLDIRSAHQEGIAAFPTRHSVELMLKHLKVASYLEIPLRTKDMPVDYLEGGRASWLIEV